MPVRGHRDAKRVACVGGCVTAASDCERRKVVVAEPEADGSRKFVGVVEQRPRCLGLGAGASFSGNRVGMVQQFGKGRNDDGVPGFLAVSSSSACTVVTSGFKRLRGRQVSTMDFG